MIAETEYQYAPLRIFDLQPALDGEVTNIRRPLSAFTADWRNLVHNHEVRWPFVFVSGYADGLQIFNLMDPESPVTVGYYDTYIGPPHKGSSRGIPGSELFNGAFGVDVRNADEALREVALDIGEGADMVMVKPALPSLDVIHRVKDAFGIPTATYQVSGEFSMIEAAAARGWLDGDAAHLEALTAIRRAGADLIVTYAARRVARLLATG